MLVSLGGKFARATPDPNVTEPALMSAALTVQIATKLNRTHTCCGDTSIILPTLGRTDLDDGASGAQFVTVEDSMGMVHASSGVLEPPSSSRVGVVGAEPLRSEATIICDVAQAIFGSDHRVSWAAMRTDNDIVRNHIANVIPGFNDFNKRVRELGGFALPHPPRDARRFPTSDGKAHFSVTSVASNSLPGGQLMLQTLRLHDQYNTTVYGHDDRYRGIKGDRHVIMVNPTDMAQLGFADADIVSVLPGPSRRARSYRIVAYPTPPGTAAAYYPEANVLLSLDHHGPGAQTPAAKAIPIRLERTEPDDGR